MNWNNAGAAALAQLDFRSALPALLKAKRTAEATGLTAPLGVAMNNLAGLYLQMGNPESAMRVAKEALAGPVGNDRSGTSSKLRYQLAVSLVRLHRFNDAVPIYRQSIEELADLDDSDALTRVLGSFGADCLDAGRLDDAENALGRALWLVRIHRVNSPANILRGLAKLKARRGDFHSAALLFDAAIESPRGMTPQWSLYTDRGEFRLNRGDLPRALEDFREARRLAAQMRADIVPADQDRVALESGLNRLAAGLVEAGNRLAQETPEAAPLHDALLRETFDAAEQDRLWSLRALIPAPNDWRTRLPNRYWDLLARYQARTRALAAAPSAELEKQESALGLELRQIEAAAASESYLPRTGAESAFAHVRAVLDTDSVLLSFHITQSGGWLWAMDRGGADVYAVPGSGALKDMVDRLTDAIRRGDTAAVPLGSRLYTSLFGAVDAGYLAHKRWLLELDGALFAVPFGALAVPGTGTAAPLYLFERAILQTVPGALLLEPHTDFGAGTFLGVGDAIYNAADSRYRGDRTRHNGVLPRLPATAAELDMCARVWNPAKKHLLTGSNADLATVRAALRTNPSVVHFATHIVSGAGPEASGLIALSLDGSGAVGLLGPAEIVAHSLNPRLVVLNGCHSGQGRALPGAGLMGLTRAWIAAGARSVLATQWDIPDEDSAAILVNFYRALRQCPECGPASALQQAQFAALKDRGFGNNSRSGNSPAVWGAYFILGRE